MGAFKALLIWMSHIIIYLKHDLKISEKMGGGGGGGGGGVISLGSSEISHFLQTLLQCLKSLTLVY
jgi:hypothetical protein